MSRRTERSSGAARGGPRVHGREFGLRQPYSPGDRPVQLINLSPGEIRARGPDRDRDGDRRHRRSDVATPADPGGISRGKPRGRKPAARHSFLKRPARGTVWAPG